VHPAWRKVVQSALLVIVMLPFCVVQESSVLPHAQTPDETTTKIPTEQNRRTGHSLCRAYST
jgi:hypothetical protein